MVKSLIDWYVVDIGFSCKKSSCGIYRSDKGEQNCLLFGEVAQDIIKFISNRNRIGIIVEAPLSYAFNIKGNPCGRKFEKAGGKTRFWYNGLGCAVMTAALFLLQTLHKSEVKSEIVLYEGFLSFKNRATKHKDDARLLFEKRNTVLDPSAIPNNSADRITSIAEIFGGEFEIPGVIIAQDAISE